MGNKATQPRSFNTIRRSQTKVRAQRRKTQRIVLLAMFATVALILVSLLALGGFAASIAIFTGNALYLAVIGACFVFSVISVILQVIYYKATGGKRIFLMAPVHHHFQEKGYSESRISYAYFTVTAILGGICILMAL